MNVELMFTVCTTVLSIGLAYIAFKKNERKENKDVGKKEGVMFSDIGYIKACVDRVEKNLSKLEDRDRTLLERLAKVEESVENIMKQIKWER